RSNHRCQKSHDESSGHKLSRTHLQRMLLHNPHLPKAILEVLSPKRTQRSAAVVPAVNVRREQNTAAQLSQSVVVLIILVTNQLFIVPAGSLNRFSGVCRKR